MKIGILTFHRAHNYGAALQCYALVNTLTNLGHKAEVIDYLPDYFKDEYSLYPHKNLSWRGKISMFFRTLLTIKKRICRRRAFNKFISQKMPLSPKQYNNKCMEIKGYDVIMFGSDQIWNFKYTYGKDSIFSGNFAKHNTKFIAYAASTTPKCITETNLEYFRGIINRFNAISVRESSVYHYLNKIKPNCCSLVLDPVFLLDKEEWSKLAVIPSKENYLLIYTVQQHNKIYEIAQKVANKLNLSIVDLRPDTGNKGIGDTVTSATPEEFLGYFRKANYIVTSSFHGTAFSIKFDKPFVTLSLGTDLDDRAQALLHKFGLNNHIMDINSMELPYLENDIISKYNNINQEIIKSKKFIINSLDNDNNTI